METATTSSKKQKKKTKRLLSIHETVNMYGGTPWFWRSQVWAGRMPVVVVGRKQWLDRRDLNRFIKAHKVTHGVV